MTPDDAFLQAILENPDDDTPRLIYADWLEERGDPRGEFIRIQCRLAMLSAADERRPLLERQERELLEHHQDKWLGALRPSLSGWTFRRGFLDAISVPAADYLQHPTFPRPATVRRVQVDLDGFVVPRPVLEFIPESVARENILLPLGFRGRTLLLAVRNPLDADLLAKIQFILNREVEQVAADAEQVVKSIEHHYGQAEFASVTTSCFIEPAIDFEADVADDTRPVARLVALIISEAMALSADQIRIEPRTENIQVLYRIGQEWVERDTPPRRLLAGIVVRIRWLADLASLEEDAEQAGHVSGASRGRPFELGVHIQPTEDGPRVTLTFLPAATEGRQEVK
jgi:uncharacterized protein (TIGR02996 family)